jgi:hypothetical protein
VSIRFNLLIKGDYVCSLVLILFVYLQMFGQRRNTTSQGAARVSCSTIGIWSNPREIPSPPKKNPHIYPYFIFMSGLLRVLNKQLTQDDGDSSVTTATVPKAALKAKWRGVCLSIHHLEEILHSGITTKSVNKRPFAQIAFRFSRPGRQRQCFLAAVRRRGRCQHLPAPKR